MTHDNDYFLELCKRYIDEQLSAKELDIFFKMIRSNMYDDILQKQMDELQNRIKNSSEIVDENPNKEKIWEEINLLIENKTSSNVIPSIEHNSKWYWIAASTIIIFICLGLLFKNKIKNEMTSSEVFYNNTITKNYKVSLLGPQNLLLPDGSTVIIREGGKVQYDSSDFSHGLFRDIYLEGEAFFDVVHDESKPFIVHTGKLYTKVMGTAFDILHDKENRLEVTVTRGKVQVNNLDQSLAILNKNKKLSYIIPSQSKKLETVDARKTTEWTNGFLIFDDLPYRNAIKMVENKFHVTIVFDKNQESIGNMKVSAKFKNNESLEDILEVLCTITNTKINTINSTQYIIR